jgi:phage shock protein C
MYCSKCGRQLEDEARYCSACGTPRSTADQRPAEAPVVKRLSRPREGKKIAGVCAGVARYLEIDVTLIRILWILVTIFPPIPGLVAYIVFWIAMPKDPEPVCSASPAASQKLSVSSTT